MFLYVYTYLKLLNTIINKIQNDEQQVNSKFVDDLNVLGAEPKA